MEVGERAEARGGFLEEKSGHAPELRAELLLVCQSGIERRTSNNMRKYFFSFLFILLWWTVTYGKGMRCYILCPLSCVFALLNRNIKIQNMYYFNIFLMKILNNPSLVQFMFIFTHLHSCVLLHINIKHVVIFYL